MLSLARRLTNQSTRPLVRLLATAAHTRIKRRAPDYTGPSKAIQNEDQEHYAQLSNTRVPVNPKHGLYGFFRKKADDQPGEQYEVVTTPEDGQMETGRSWEAAELRNKSFKDLHTLWYVSLRERNLLATQKEEARRMGVSNVDLQVPMGQVRACRKTMARIKYVLNERRLMFEGAVKVAEQQIYAAIEKHAKKTPYNAQDLAVAKFQHKLARQVAGPSAKQDASAKRGPRRGQPKPSKKSRTEAKPQEAQAS